MKNFKASILLGLLFGLVLITSTVTADEKAKDENKAVVDGAAKETIPVEVDDMKQGGGYCGCCWRGGYHYCGRQCCYPEKEETEAVENAAAYEVSPDRWGGGRGGGWGGGGRGGGWGGGGRGGGWGGGGRGGGGWGGGGRGGGWGGGGAAAYEANNEVNPDRWGGGRGGGWGGGGRGGGWGGGGRGGGWGGGGAAAYEANNEVNLDGKGGGGKGGGGKGGRGGGGGGEN